MTRKGSLIPNVFFGSAGQVIYVVLQREETPVSTSLVVHTAKTLGPRVRWKADLKEPGTSPNPQPLNQLMLKKTQRWTLKQKLNTGLDINKKITWKTNPGQQSEEFPPVREDSILV